MAEFTADINVVVKVRVDAKDWREALEKVNRVSIPMPQIVSTDGVEVVEWEVSDTLYVIDVAAVRGDGPYASICSECNGKDCNCNGCGGFGQM